MKKFIVIASILAATVSFAKQCPCNESHKHHKPPKEAIEICEGKAVDSACQMKSSFGDLMSGTCQNTPDENYFACKPDREPKQEK